MGHQQYLQLKPPFLHAWRMPNTLTCGENESRTNVQVMRKEVVDHHYCSNTHGALPHSDCRCDGVMATFVALSSSRLARSRWWLASWETVTFKNTTGEEEISRKSTSSIFIMGLMLCVRFKLDVVTVVLHKDGALWKRSGEHPVKSARGDFQPSVCFCFINTQLHADMAGSSTTVHTSQCFMWSQFHDCVATLMAKI